MLVKKTRIIPQHGREAQQRIKSELPVTVENYGYPCLVRA